MSPTATDPVAVDITRLGSLDDSAVNSNDDTGEHEALPQPSR